MLYLSSSCCSFTGNMIKFKSGNLTPITSTLLLGVLITNTKIGRNTKSLVASVSERTKRHPDAMCSGFHQQRTFRNHQITHSQWPWHDRVWGKDWRADGNESRAATMHGVSHASIETVLQTTLKCKLTSKLTGAGGGGCVITLLPTCILKTRYQVLSVFVANFCSNIILPG